MKRYSLILLTMLFLLQQAFAEPVMQNLKLWLRADSLSHLQNGAVVDTWNDESGLGHNAYSSSTSRPTYYSSAINGRAALRFDGSNDQLFISGSSDYNFTEATIFTVRSPQNRAGTVISIAKDGTLFDNEFLIYGNHTYHVTGAGVFTVKGHQSVPSTAFFTTSVIGSSPSDIYYGINGVASTLSATPSNGGGSTMPSVTRNITIGGRGLNVYGESFQGDIAEILVYSGKLNAQEIQSVEYYLSGKYSMGNLVPEPQCFLFAIIGIFLIRHLKK